MTVFNFPSEIPAEHYKKIDRSKHQGKPSTVLEFVEICDKKTTLNSEKNLTIEGSFLIANLHKFKYGGWFTLLLASLYFIIMFGWYFGRKLKNRYVTFTDLYKYIDLFKDLS